MARPLTIAVPKGRILKQLCVLLEKAGLDPATLRADDRRLVRDDPEAGLRYLLPIGPLRIDAAFSPDRRSGEDEWVVHFGIGMPF